LPLRFAVVSGTWWLPDGSGVLFAGRPRATPGTEAGGQIWLQPYPAGPARRITHDLIEYRVVSSAADGASLVTVGMDYAAAIWVLQPDGTSEPRRVPSLRYDGLGGLAWLGRDRFVFTSNEAGGAQIWTMDADGRNRRQLTTEGANGWPRPAPDGRSIYVVSSRSGRPGIWQMDVEGGNARPIAYVSDAAHLSVTPDGRWLVFTSGAEGADATWKLPVTGGTPALVAKFMARAAVSPDGRFVAGIWRETPGSALLLAVVPLDGGPPVHTFQGPFTTTGAGAVEWSADGRSLLYTTAERSNIWLQRVDGGSPVQVTRFAEGTVFGFARALDGGALVMSRGTSARDAFLITGLR
jgi:Tol biopolymer transport system component